MFLDGTVTTMAPAPKEEVKRQGLCVIKTPYNILLRFRLLKDLIPSLKVEERVR